MKKVPCAYEKCGLRRAHHERQDEPRGTQMVEVPDEFKAGSKAYCSMTCALMAGAMTLKYEDPK